jgi:putative heme-binding domain-containing protein
LATVFGDGRALEALEKLAADPQADVPARRNAIRVLVENRTPGLAPMLQKLLADRALINDAVHGLAFYDHPDTPKLLLNQYARLDAHGRQEAINTLAARPQYARALLKRVEEGAISASDISAYHVRQMLSFDDADLSRRLSELWGTIRESPAERKQQIAELKSSLAAEVLQNADLSSGRLLFNKSCANCHTLFGQGARIGPDLTGANRKNLDYLLENIVDPSATLAANFRMSVIVLSDGRIVTGVVVEQNERTLKVQTQREQVVINRGEVEEISQQQLSLMPDGLLNNLTATQVRDLIAYLSGSTQVELPAEAADAISQEGR